ncbi:immunoglobulin domain protein [Cooperia oncophora]
MDLQPRHITEPPPIFTSSANYSAAVGYPAFLHCQTQPSSEVEIKWFRFGSIMVSDVNKMIHSNGTLQILATSRADAGSYECQARNRAGMSNLRTMLERAQ